MNYEKYLILSEPFRDGFRKRYLFENGYGASVVKHSFSYGGERGLFELAVINKDGDLVYDTPVTDSVIGFLNQEDVDSLLEKIKKLEKIKNPSIYTVELNNKPYLNVKVKDKEMMVWFVENPYGNKLKLSIDVLPNLVDTLIEIQNSDGHTI